MLNLKKWSPKILKFVKYFLVSSILLVVISCGSDDHKDFELADHELSKSGLMEQDPISKSSKICDWEFEYQELNGFITIKSTNTPSSKNIEQLFLEFIPGISGFDHPIMNETLGFAIHEYSEVSLDTSLNIQDVEIPRGVTGFKMGLNINFTAYSNQGDICEANLFNGFVRSDDYYPSGAISLPINAKPNYEKYNTFVNKLPEPTAQSVMLATITGNWNENWETENVRKINIPIRIGLFGEIQKEDYDTIRDLLEILKIIAPDLDIDYAKSINETTLPIHFITCTAQINRDNRYCRINDASGSFSFNRNDNPTKNLFNEGWGFIRISGQRINRHTLTHEIGHSLGLKHWNINNCSMCYPNSQMSSWSALDLMTIFTIYNTKVNHKMNRFQLQNKLNISDDLLWKKYNNEPFTLDHQPSSVWLEMGDKINREASIAIENTNPNYK